MDERLAALVARRRVRQVEAMAALEIRPEEITMHDFEPLPRLFELKVGGATERIGREAEASVSALEEMERQIALLDERERLEGGSRGDDGEP